MNRYLIMKKRTKGCIPLVMIAVSLPLFLKAQDTNKFEFYSALQINSMFKITANQQNAELMHRYYVLDQTAVFPENYLNGEFQIYNRTTDTLKLAPASQPLVQYLKLKYTYRGDSLSLANYISFNQKEVITWRKGIGDMPTWGQGNFLPPHEHVELSTAVGWTELSKLRPGVVDFQWIYDNSAEALRDSTLTPVNIQGKIRGFNVGAMPRDKLDSLYYLDFLAEYRVYSADSVQRGLEICMQLLKLDSSYYRACLMATDALWKLEGFNEAISYAQRGKRIIEAALQEKPKTDYDHGRYYIDILNDRLELMQRHEKFRMIKKLRE